MELQPFVEFVSVPTILPQNSATGASITGTGVNTTGYKTCGVVCTFGTLAPDGLSSVVKIEESDDNSSWSDVTGAVFPAKAGTGDNTVQYGHIQMRSRKKYLRASAAITGSPTAHNIAVSFLLGGYIKSLDATQLGTGQPAFSV